MATSLMSSLLRVKTELTLFKFFNFPGFEVYPKFYDEAFKQLDKSRILHESFLKSSGKP